MKPTTRKLTHSALMLALALLLSMIKFYHFPNGGSITAASMAPIIIISLMYDTRWALFTSFAYSLLQMLEGFYPPPVQSFGMFVALILLDYVVAFGVLGLAGPVARRFQKEPLGAAVGSIVVVFCRFFCSFLSGIIVWGSYAPEGTPVWIYSLTVNGPIMIGEMITTSVVVALLVKFIDFQKLAGKSSAAA